MSTLVKTVLLSFVMTGVLLSAQSADLFVTYDLSDGLVTEDIKSLGIDLAGNVWIGGKNDGLSLLDINGGIKSYSEGDNGFFGSPVKSFHVSAGGAVYVSTRQGTNLVSGTTWSTLRGNGGFPSDNHFSILFDANDVFWMATDAGVVRDDGATLRTFTTWDGLAANKVFDMALDLTGQLWVATEAGVSRYSDGSWFSNFTGSGLTGKMVRAIEVDNAGNIWIGTAADGVIRYDGTSWKSYGTANGLGSNVVWSLATGNDGVVWVGTLGGGLSRFDGKRWVTYTTADGLPSNYVGTVITAPDGSVWVGTDKGVARLTLEMANQKLLLSCDYNGDGRATISDAVALIRLYLANPAALEADHNQDGVFNTKDLIQLIFDIRSGYCASGLSMLAASEDSDPAPIDNRQLAELVEDILPELKLTPAELVEFKAALNSLTESASLPKTFSLAASYPNPFNPSTTISFTIPQRQSAHVNLTIFDTRGAVVKTLVDGQREAGDYSVFWDGGDNRGNRVSSGVYFYRLQAGDYTAVRKMVLLK